MSILNKKIRRGFTIVELMVSVAIIGVISGLFLTNYHRYKTTSEIDQAVQGLASFLRGLQNNTLSLKEYSGAPTGWGAYFTRGNNRIQYFADLNANGWIDAGENSSLREYVLPYGVRYTNMSLNGASCPSCNNVTCSFIPPDPEVRICRNNATQCDGNKVINLELTDRDGRIKNIIINKTGLVDIK